MKLVAPGKKPITLPALQSSAATRVWFATRLEKMVRLMDKSLLYWITAAYRVHPNVAEDASPSKLLAKRLDELAEQWETMFDNMSKKLAQEFVDKAKRHSDQAFRIQLKRAGFSVDFNETARMRDALEARIDENIDLIKSIAADHLADVKRRVMYSAQKGRSLKSLTESLKDILTQDQPGWKSSKTLRRAQFIARDQNNKATATFHKARQQEVGIRQARWSHTLASKHPRESHKAFNGHLYDVEKGHDFGDGLGPVLPGEAPNCGCTSRSVIPGFDDEGDE